MQSASTDGSRASRHRKELRVRILLVEDSPMNSTFFQAVLEPEGHEVTVEVTGTAGRERALTEPFDLIVLDIVLPGLRGDAVCKELKATGLRTPLIALTASALPEQMAVVQAAGFDECLIKPIAPEDLRSVVRRYAHSGSS
ncbi:MAG: response regulator [Chloroflexota bacterium]|nr:response regulator [Chloroflexota bacterium]